MLQITNFKSNQTIHYNLPQLDGRVFSLCDHSNARQCSEKCCSNVICVCNDQRYKTQVWQGNFWLLIHLIEGDNLIHLSWDQDPEIKLDFNLKFQQRDTIFYLHFLYLTCTSSPENDATFDEGHFQSPPDFKSDELEAKKKIKLAALMMQTFFARTVCKDERRFGTKSFRLQLDSKCWPIVQTVKLSTCVQQIHRMSEKELWTHVAEHILKHPHLFHLNKVNCDNNEFVHPSSIKYVAFCSFTRYVYEKQLDESGKVIPLCSLKYEQLMQMARGFVCMGGGDLALIGVGSLFTWPSQTNEIVECFRNDRVIDETKFLDDSGNNPSTYGGVYTTSFGSALHELAHIFDIGHAYHGIMSRQLEQINQFFDNQAYQKRFNKRPIRWWRASAFAIFANHPHLKASSHRRPIDAECIDDKSLTTTDCLSQLSIFDSFMDKFKDKHNLCYDSNHFYFDEKKFEIWSKHGIRLIEYRDADGQTIDFERFQKVKERLKLKHCEQLFVKKKVDKLENYFTIFMMDSMGNPLRFE